MGYTKQQIDTLEIINYTCASLSVIGSLFIIISYLTFNRLQERFAYSLIFFLAIADLIRSVGKIWGSFLSDDVSVEFQCSFAGFITNFGGLSSFLFVMVITLVIYTAVQMKYAPFWSVKPKELRKRKYYIAIIVWSVTLCISSLPLINISGYGYVGAWCWITSDYHYWRWICFYGPLISIFLFCIVMYTIIINILHKVEQSIPEKNRGQFGMYTKLKYYPLVLLIAFLFPTIRRIYQMFDDEAPFWLGVLHTLGAGLYGGLNAIVYGVNQSLKKEYKKSLEGTITTREMKVVQAIDIESTASKFRNNVMQNTTPKESEDVTTNKENQDYIE